MAARKPKNPFNDLADLVKSQMYGSRPTTTVSTQKKIKDVGTLVKTVDTFATGGLGRAVVADSKAQSRGNVPPVNLATYGVTSLAAGAVGAVVARGAGRAASKAYEAAKKTSSSSRVVLFHGGPVELKGGVIDPSFVRGDVSSGRISGNVAALNQQSLGRVPFIRSQMENNMKFVENALTDPNYFPAGRVDAMASIKKSREQIARLDVFAEKAKKVNYFTGVGSAKETYAHQGAIHVINPKKKDVTTLLGPGGEYQVVGTQKPVASFPTGGRPGEQMDTAIRLAQQTGDKLRKKLERQAVIKQTAKNLISKRK